MREPLPSLVKLSLALLLLAALLPLPFVGYHTIHNICFVGFLYLIYYAYTLEGSEWLLTLLVPTIVIFQPFEKVAFSRTTWMVTDVLLALGLILWFIMAQREYKKQRH